MADTKMQRYKEILSIYTMDPYNKFIQVAEIKHLLAKMFLTSDKYLSCNFYKKPNFTAYFFVSIFSSTWICSICTYMNISLYWV